MIRNLLFISRQFGFDPIKLLRAIRFIPKYTHNIISYTLMNKGFRLVSLSPTLNDFEDSAGSASGHYFWQDLIAAQWIYSRKPRHHLDIASRIDGFVAHIATFMPIEVLDIRQMNSDIPNVKFRQLNLQEPTTLNGEKYDSVSCLHAIEHFGLGRYGDDIELNGHISGLINIANLVAKGGRLYLSYPTGTVKTEFNAQRILSPNWALDLLDDFDLIQSALIPWNGRPSFNIKVEEVDTKIRGQAILMELQKK